MTNDERELAGWQSEWREIADLPAFEREVGARVVRDRRRLFGAAAGEVGGAALGVAALTWLIVRSHGSTVILTMAIPLLVFFGAWLTRFFEVRRGLFQAPSESVHAFVELTRKRLETELEWLRFAKRATASVGAAAAVWAAWVFVKHFDQYAAEPWRAVLGFGGAGVILGGLAWWMPRKRARLAEDLARFEAVVGRANLDG